ncbi:MAG: MFS transporter [Rhodocyclales bacterium GWA2_65_19]|nr:MAG: MFS transporter [Rhodocyclales bacterium GWA2_65_19]
MSRQILADGVRVREVWAWAMYDFANSAYTTTVVTAIFNAYFVAVVAAGAPWATLAWTSAQAIASIAIMLTAASVGAYADRHGAKKKLLGVTTAGCVAGTAALFWVGPGDVVLAMALVAIASFFFGSSENIIAAFLPELAGEEDLGKVSGWGWSWGYLGGMACLGLCLAYIVGAKAQGAGAAQFVPVTMLITAAFFAVASAPTFLLLRERTRATPVADAGAGAEFSALAHRLLRTAREAQRFPDMARFLVCLLCYQSGVFAAIALAAIYAQEAIGFTAEDNIKLFFVVNGTAAVGAFAFGYLQDRLGHVRTIALTLAGWLLMTAIALSSDSREQFWVAANIAGLCLGSSQSAARALVGLFAPAQRRAEFFGLWGLAMKLAAVAGPMTYGLTTWLSGGNHRLALAVTGLYFVAGLLLLIGIDERRGREAALAA